MPAADRRRRGPAAALSGEWVLTDYPSDYLSLEVRLRLTAAMVAVTDGALMDNEPEPVAAFDGVYGAQLHETMLRGLSRLVTAYPVIRGDYAADSALRERGAPR